MSASKPTQDLPADASAKADLYNASVGIFGRGLAGLDSVLRKGADHGKANNFAEADMLQARLYPNMFPLQRQVEIVCDFAWSAPARLAGLDPKPFTTETPGFAALHERIAHTKEFLDGLTPGQFEGREAIEVTFPVGQDQWTMPGAQYLMGFATQNFFFHYVTAYGILRHLGVDLGKRDYFGV